MRRKFAALLLSAAMVCSILAGCSSSGPASSTPSTSKPSNDTSTTTPPGGNNNNNNNNGNSGNTKPGNSGNDSSDSSNSSTPVKVISVIPSDPDSSSTIDDTGLLKFRFDSGNYYIAKDSLFGNELYYSFTVTNPNKSNGVPWGRLLIELKNASGETVKGINTSIPAIGPNDTITFGGSTSFDDDSYAGISFSVDYLSISGAPSDGDLFINQSDLKISGASRSTASGVTHFTGKVTNTGSVGEGFTNIYVFFRKDGKLLYGGQTYLSKIDANQSASFDISVRTDIAKSYPYVILAAPIRTAD